MLKNKGEYNNGKKMGCGFCFTLMANFMGKGNYLEDREDGEF